jgi:hypothetical protein|tara:strand:+ start:16 stop:414 length:399 start_codon:yes stop_codon:yes gene_type:complete
MRQFNLFKNSSADNQKTQKYSTTIEVPVYEPKNKKPHILELYDKSKTQLLISNIEESSVSDDEKAFLIESAKRHIVFNYEKIADYYSHSSKEVQELMEQSALVIIDFEKAIGYGYVRLCNEIREQYLEEYEK